MWFSGTVAIPLSNFYTFGGEAGDNQVPAGADGASPAIVLPRLFRFGGTTQEKFYVSYQIYYQINTEDFLRAPLPMQIWIIST